MSDIVAQLEVLSQESGCLLDLSAILDLSICPKIDLKIDKEHKVEEKDDVICVTPTHDHKKDERCGDKSCYEVSDKVCKKNHTAFDLELLVILGLLTEEELEKYLKTMGEMDEDDKLNMNDGDVEMDPLLSLGVGDDDSILDLEVAGEDGLLDLDLLDQEGLLNLGGEGALLNLGGKDKGLQGLGGILRRSYRSGSGNQRLADVLTENHKRQNKGLLDVNVGGYQDEDEATIDLDLLTRPRPNGGNGNNGNNGNGNNGNDDDEDDNEGTHGGFLSHYQPLCKKGFKSHHRHNADKCHARDVNHCLAICHSQSALLTLEADVQVGDVANILLCAAIEFDQSEDGDNCHYFVAPEHEPCHDDELEEKENCFTFVRN